MPCPFRGSHRSSPSLRICVIGAGAAGLCAARRAVEQLPRAEVTILEQSDQLGGTWVYTEQPQGTQPTHSSMYDELRTNIPKEIMHFCDFPIESVDFPDPQNSDDSFPRREVILSYLKRFAEPIKHLIKFNLRVLSIAPIAQAKNSHLNGQHQAKDGTSDTKWRIVSEETIGSKRRFVEHFDVVFVCTGHYWCPRIPIFANKLAIRWAHSHSYRKAEHFAGMKVAIVGANLSGLEIALQLAKYAEKVYLINSNANATLGTVKGSPNSEVPVELNGSRVTDAVADSLVLADGRVVGPLHFVLFCTGYRFSFPFFDQQTEAPVVRCDGNFVSPLIGHVAHPHFLSSLFFVGLNLLVVPFSCFDIQTHFALALLTGGVPNASERFTMEVAKHWEEKRTQRMKAENMAPKYFHRLGPDQWEYFGWLNSLSGFKPLPKVIENIYKFNLEQKSKSPLTYRNIRYRIVDDQNFTTK